MLIAVLCLAPSVALAQAASESDLLGPASPHLKGPPTTYRSAFGSPPAETEATPWRAANEEAGRLGGHVGQLQDAETGAEVKGHELHGAAAAPPSRMNSHEHK
jgi:hypothetical protein